MGGVRAQEELGISVVELFRFYKDLPCVFSSSSFLFFSRFVSIYNTYFAMISFHAIFTQSQG